MGQEHNGHEANRRNRDGGDSARANLMRSMIIALALLFVAGAPSGPAVEPGDTPDQVIATMGPPQGRMVMGTAEIWGYERGDVVFENGIVESVELLTDDELAAKKRKAQELERSRQSATPPPPRPVPPTPVPVVSTLPPETPLEAERKATFAQHLSYFITRTDTNAPVLIRKDRPHAAGSFTVPLSFKRNTALQPRDCALVCDVMIAVAGRGITNITCVGANKGQASDTDGTFEVSWDSQGLAPVGRGQATIYVIENQEGSNQAPSDTPKLSNVVQVPVVAEDVYAPGPVPSRPRRFAPSRSR